MEENTDRVDPRLLLQTYVRSDAAIALPMKKNEPMVRFLGAWWTSEIAWDPPSVISSDATWDDLWEYTTCETPRIAMAAGVSSLECMMLMQKARELKMILPNGEVQPAVQRWLNMFATAHIAKLGKEVAKLQITQLAAEEKRLKAEEKAKKRSNQQALPPGDKFQA